MDSEGVMDTTAGPVGETSIEWDKHRGKRVTIRAAKGSIAAQMAARYLRPADDIVGELQKLLDATKEQTAEAVEIYLLDPLPDVPAALTGGEVDDPFGEPEGPMGGDVGDNGVIHFVQAEEPPGAIGPAIAEFVVRKWFGYRAAMAGVLIEGLGALAAARAEAGPSIEEGNAWVQQETASGRTVSLVGGGGGDDMVMEAPPGDDMGDLMGGGPGGPPGGPDGPDGPEGGPDEMPPGMDMGGPPDMPPGIGPDGPGGEEDEIPPAVSASFLSWLITNSDPGSLRKFSEAYTPDSRDQASLQVFRQPLAALEEQWQQSVGGQKGATMMSFFKFLTPLLRPHLIEYFETLVYMTISALFAVAIPLVSGCMVDALNRAGHGGPKPGGLCGLVSPTLTTGRILVVVAILFVAYLIDSGLEIRRAFVEGKLYNAIGVTLRERTFGHLLRLPQSFYARARVGDIAVRLSGDMDQLQAGLQQIFSTGVFMLVTSTMAAVAALLKSWTVGIVILLIVPVFIFTNRVLGKRIAQRSYEIQELDGQTAAILQETLSAQQVVKAFGLEKRVMSTYVGRLLATVRAAIRLMLTGHVYEGTISFATTFAQLLVLTVGSLLVINGSLKDPGTLVALLLLLPSIIGPLRQLADMGEVVQTSSGSMQRVTQILDEPVDVDDSPDAIELPRIEKDITFQDIHFGYDHERPILTGLNLTIPHGMNVAIVGPSGSGKSTVVNLLLRFWDPESGSISIDGHDIKGVTMQSLRDQIGIVFQDTFVFNTTLRDNIALAKEGASDAEITAAADAAQLQSLIDSLPAGMDTVLGERGVRMSGGQRQRLAIARALLRDPAILIFDEATSALDARTETEIRETISQVVSGRTTISITHRLGIAADADIVVVLDGGVVAEMGPHSQLVTAGGLYQALYEEQMGHVTAGGRPRLGPEAARLKKVPMFADLDPEVLASLSERLLLERFSPGEDIVRQGDPGDKLYILTRGAADVLVNIDRGGTRVNRIKEGDYFGEYALLTGEERTATVRATQPTEVYSLAKQEFTELVESEPRLQQILSDFVTQRAAAFAAAAQAAGITAGVGA
ncbi:MAG: ATP-binding cassette domain-containing protein [Actinomycetota bacterium]